MLKLQYDLKTGEVKKAYPSAYDVAVPYIEIDEATNDKISQDVGTIYFVVDGALTTIQTADYLAKKQLKENALKKTELQNQINELDIKRIRAICEPCQKDENTTWLEFYNTQILDLRKQISEL